MRCSECAAISNAYPRGHTKLRDAVHTRAANTEECGESQAAPLELRCGRHDAESPRDAATPVSGGVEPQATVELERRVPRHPRRRDAGSVGIAPRAVVDAERRTGVHERVLQNRDADLLRTGRCRCGEHHRGKQAARQKTSLDVSHDHPPRPRKKTRGLDCESARSGLASYIPAATSG